MRGLDISFRTAVASALLLIAVGLPGGCKKSCGREAAVEYRFPPPRLSPDPIDYDCLLPTALQKRLDDGEVCTPSEGAAVCYELYKDRTWEPGYSRYASCLDQSQIICHNHLLDQYMDGGLLYSLWLSEDPNLWEPVCRVLDGDEETRAKINTRAVALERLIDIGRVHAFPILRVAATDPDDKVRWSAFRGIASLGGEEPRAFLRASLRSEDAEIRSSVIVGLGLAGMFEEIEDALHDSDPEVAASAKRYVERYNGEVWDRTGKRHVPVSDEVRINRYELGASIHDGPAGEVIDSFGDFEPPDEYDYGPYMDSRRRWVYEFIKKQVEENEKYDLIYEVVIPGSPVFLVPVASVDERADWRGRSHIRLKMDADEVVSLLGPLFVYDDYHYRREVIHTLVNLGGEAAIESLALMLDDLNPHVVELAIAGLGKIGGPAALEHLVIIARNMQDCVPAMQAAQALGEIGTPEAVHTLIWMVTKGLKQENNCLEKVHDADIIELPLALGKTGSKEVVPVLMELIQDDLAGREMCPLRRRMGTSEALVSLGEVGGEGALDLLRQAAGFGYHYAILALGDMGDPGSTDVLLRQAKDEDPSTRFYAGMALSALGHPDATTIMLEAQKDGSMGCYYYGSYEYVHEYCEKFRVVDKMLAHVASTGDAVGKILVISRSDYLQSDESLRILVDLLDEDDLRVRGRALLELYHLTGLSFGYDQDAWNDWLTKVLKTGSVIEEHKAFQEVYDLSMALKYPTKP